MFLENDDKNDDRIRRKAYHVDNPVQAKRNDDKNDDRIRRKAYNLDNPVQAKRSSGYRNPSIPQNSVGVQPASGLSTFKTYGLEFEKRACKRRSLEQDINLLK